MKVRISYTIEVDDEMRRAINAYYGEPGRATREALKTWYRNHGESVDGNAHMELRYEEDNALQPTKP